MGSDASPTAERDRIPTPTELASADFRLARRGYDTAEVRRFLAAAGEWFARLQRRVEDLQAEVSRLAWELDASRAELEQARSQSPPEPGRAAMPVEVDEELLLAKLGTTAATMLDAARAAAAEVRERARVEAEETLARSRARAEELERSLQELLAEKAAAPSAAEEEARRRLEAADREVEARLEQARREAEVVARHAELEAMATRRAAEEERERLLEGAEQRRRALRVELGRLVAAREIVLGSLRSARQAIEDAEAQLGPSAEPSLEPMAEEDVAGPAGPEMDLPSTPSEPGVPELEGLDDVGGPVLGGLAERFGELEEPDPAPPEERSPEEPVAVEAAVEEPVPEADEPVTSLSTPSLPVVEGLFARLRADRMRAAAEARAVLSEGGGEVALVADADDATAGDAPPEVAPAGEVAGEEQAAEAALVGRSEIRRIEVPTAVSSPLIEVLDAEAEAGGEESGDAALLAERAKLVNEVEAVLLRRAKRALQDDQNEVLDQVRQRWGSEEGFELPPEEPQRRRMVVASAPLLEEVLRRGAAFAGGSVAVEEVERLSSAVAERMAAALSVPLRRRVLDLLADAGSDVEAAERTGVAYREWRGERIASLVGDAVVEAFSRGVLAISGEGSTVWIVDDGGRPCPDCEDNALSGEVPVGEPFPTGQDCPPAHPGCRCLLARRSV